MCCYDETPDFEISIQGHRIVRYADGSVLVDGKDFHTDLKNISSIIEVLTDILETASEARKPRLVIDDPIVVSHFGGYFPHKAANNNQ